jgi:histone chaperone ASF1
MSLVNIINVTVLNNPTHFSSAFQFQIQFECLQELPEGIFILIFKLKIFK